MKCHIKRDRMLICGSQRASESVLVDFVTAERESVSLPFPPQEKKKGGRGGDAEKLSKLRNALGVTQIAFSKACARIRNDRIINCVHN